MFELFKNNRGFRIAAILAAAQALAMIVISIFRTGGEEFVTSMFDNFSPVYAIIATLAVGWGWVTSTGRELSKRIWGYMAAGLFLWAVAEILWIYYSIQYQDEIPYPSPADFFWLVGYIPLFYSMILRWRSLKTSLNLRQWLWLAVINAVFLLFSAVFIYMPIFQDADPERWLETLVNVLYTLADLLLFAISLGIFFFLHRGRISTVWYVILVSNIIMSIADLLFTYASWNESTLSGNVFYIIYVIFSLLYLNSYLLRALGMYINHVFLVEAHKNSLSQATQKNTNLNMAVIFTNAGNLVISTSQNFAVLAGAKSPAELKSRPLHEMLGVGAEEIAKMISSGRQKGYISNYPMTINTPLKKSVRSVVTATMEGWDLKTFNGMNLVLRIQASDQVLTGLDNEQSAIANRILIDTGQQSSENIISIKEYFTAIILGLFNLVNSFAGKSATSSMQEQFNRTVKKNRWDIEFSFPNIQISEEYKEDQLSSALGQLLTEYKDYAVNVTDASVVADEIIRIERQLGSRTVQVAGEFKLRHADAA